MCRPCVCVGEIFLFRGRACVGDPRVTHYRCHTAPNADERYRGPSRDEHWCAANVIAYRRYPSAVVVAADVEFVPARVRCVLPFFGVEVLKCVSKQADANGIRCVKKAVPSRWWCQACKSGRSWSDSEQAGF